MVAKRIIPCLDVKNGRTVKGIQFEDLRDVGDPRELARYYSECGADELVLLDITATQECRGTFEKTVREVAEVLSIPLTVGGGIASIADIRDLLNAGADKVSINSAAVKVPELINKAAREFGSQCVVVAVDSRRIQVKDRVYIGAGKVATDLDTLLWIEEVEERGAGEILLTSMDRDGTKLGFDCDLLTRVGETITIPLIASGGAGVVTDFVDVFSIPGVDAALAAGILHRSECTIQEIKAELSKAQIEVRI